MKSKIIDEEFINAETLSKRRNISLSYIKRARLHLGLPFYRLDEIKFILSEFDQWAKTRRKAS